VYNEAQVARLMPLKLVSVILRWFRSGNRVSHLGSKMSFQGHLGRSSILHRKHLNIDSVSD
jgi:hypothetical protein